MEPIDAKAVIRDRSPEELLLSSEDAAVAQSALTVLLARHGPDVLRYLEKRVKFNWSRFLPEDSYQDIYQDACAKAWASRAGFRSELSSFRTWFFRIAKSLLLDLLRSKGSKSRTDKERPPVKALDGSEATPEGIFLELHGGELFQAWWLTLGPRDRVVVTLLVDKGLKRDELADAFGVSRRTVYAWITRLIESFREFLHRHGYNS